MSIDQKWFMRKIAERDMSLRGLAREMDMDPSALSRMLSGHRKMQMDEAKQIAQFLRAPVAEVMKHAGVAVDIDGMPTRIMLTSTINHDGELERLKTPTPLPQSVIYKAQAAIKGANSQIIAAQVRADKGALAAWDDCVLLFKPTDMVDPSAIGQLSIVRNAENQIAGLCRIISARKTGEAKILKLTGVIKEVTLETAAPVIAVIP